MANQHTIAGPAVCAGVGVHTGAHTRVVLRPAPVNAGIAFVRSDLPDSGLIPADARLVGHSELGTTLRNASGAEIATVEHLLAACAGLGVDNLIAEIDGPEVPILDGSAAPFVQVLLNAGLRDQHAPRRVIRVRRTIEATHGAKRVALSPTDGDALELDVTIRFSDPAIGVQRRTARLDHDSFRADIAGARTFGFMADLAMMHERGRGRGASFDNTVVIEQGRVINPEGLRFEDEFVRHKLLDAIGDLALAGAPIAARYTGDQPGHALNTRLVQALLDAPDAWTWDTLDAPVYAAAHA
ncbi:MAG: UDP-3-O-acyl-N-acetylglucosamine deacetylase [Alphaproteobacteria bacterium]|nr:UDP-3-O-acyl-N-acetylglucosamine deacetylase [Alphaproteobacteria bacterium]